VPAPSGVVPLLLQCCDCCLQMLRLLPTNVAIAIYVPMLQLLSTNDVVQLFACCSAQCTNVAIVIFDFEIFSMLHTLSAYVAIIVDPCCINIFFMWHSVSCDVALVFLHVAECFMRCCIHLDYLFQMFSAGFDMWYCKSGFGTGAGLEAQLSELSWASGIKCKCILCELKI
jgi:hypothetical protein